MLTIQNLSFSYPGKKLFSETHLKLQPGSIYGMLGLNGAGKTSLLRLMCGLLFPQQGSCLFGNSLITDRHPSVLGSIYLIPEKFTLPETKIRDFAALYAPFYPAYREEEFHEALDAFALSQTTCLHRLSYGEQKKVLLSFGFALNTPLLLLDEPTNGLDIPGKSQFRKMLSRLDPVNRCVVISTHQVRDLGQTLDRLILLHEGKILLEDSLEAISRRWQCTVLAATELDKAVYSEPQLGGYRALVPASSVKSETEFDLELFFNAAVHKPGALFPNLKPSLQTAL
ncbi:MAG: ABC transporter ATP-binding protein [Candidatus Cyclonatronum sp.]|uniref:ABC transporter ATP-binding protein n=1 Tax=Cyclonatronum sp. TaxID=3024185 RepID=UPI0025BA6F7A|nr:ABC transporter ATP-binding protein [Cyclonatronum sp.]MCC5932842.1 ABC transporter ATP-binding protein [Balneolales bacterium]MCH8485632.1 ABC transporter ATP-binding protein [Cyclonatronum sp.]